MTILKKAARVASTRVPSRFSGVRPNPDRIQQLEEELGIGAVDPGAGDGPAGVPEQTQPEPEPDTLGLENASYTDLKNLQAAIEKEATQLAERAEQIRNNPVVADSSEQISAILLRLTELKTLHDAVGGQLQTFTTTWHAGKNQPGKENNQRSR